MLIYSSLPSLPVTAIHAGPIIQQTLTSMRLGSRDRSPENTVCPPLRSYLTARPSTAIVVEICACKATNDAVKHRDILAGLAGGLAGIKMKSSR